MSPLITFASTCIYIAIGAIAIESIPISQVVGRQQPQQNSLLSVNQPQQSNSTFPLTLVASNVSSCISLQFRTNADCKKFFKNSQTSCTFSPKGLGQCTPTGYGTACTKPSGSKCSIDVPIDLLANVGAVSSTCGVMMLGPSQTITALCSSDNNWNATGNMTFSYASNAECQKAAGVMKVASWSLPCQIVAPCKDNQGNPTNKIVISPIAGSNVISPYRELCGVEQFLHVPFRSFVIDYGNSSVQGQPNC
jgi:hypothetical protein